MIILDLNFVEIKFQSAPRASSRSRFFDVPYDRRIIATLPNSFRRIRGWRYSRRVKSSGCEDTCPRIPTYAAFAAKSLSDRIY